VYGYCLVTGTKYVLDHHSAAFLRAWDWALPAQRFLARKAVTNIVTNQHWADTIQAWNASTYLVGHPIADLPQGDEYPVKPGFSVAFVSTFSADEPLGKFLKAAGQLPDVSFYVTGDPKGRFAGRMGELPPNVTFTGFLPDGQYVGLLRAASAVMALTTRNFTLQCGGYEAVSIGQPLITSDWPFLRAAFPRGAVYAANTSEGIRDAVLTVRREHQRLQEEMLAYQDTARQRWEDEVHQLNQLVQASFRGDETGSGD
jgi:glycosyltransferase involved in cell wall biosynthesis